MDDKTGADAEMDVLKIPRPLANKLRVIAAARRRSMKALFEQFAGRAIDREYRKVVAEMAEQFDVGGEA